MSTHGKDLAMAQRHLLCRGASVSVVSLQGSPRTETERERQRLKEKDRERERETESETETKTEPATEIEM